MSVKFANNAYGTLSAGITASGTSITLSSGQGARFPSLSTDEYFYATLIDTSNNLEIVKVTARSGDVLTATRGQESTTAQAFAIGDRLELRVTAGGLEDATNPYDKDTSSTGSFALPSGTTAQQPAAADTEGHIRYDSDDSVVYFSDGTDWIKISAAVPILTSVTGSVVVGLGTTLTLTGSGFLTANLEVNFDQSSDSIDETITVTPASDTSATVTLTSAIYSNITAGNSLSITVTNSDGVTSAAINKTALAAPSGGTVTTSGNYRIHKFTSSGSFVNTIASLSTEYLVVAGGGAGGSFGGGGGAGGMITGTVSSLSAATHAITVGAGGGRQTGWGQGAAGSNSAFGSYSATGGGGGGFRSVDSNTGSTGSNGGSGGGGGHGNTTAGAGGSGTSGQGNNGGSGLGSTSFTGDPDHAGGGGGGKGAAGANAVGGSSGTGGGNGGNGTASSITGSPVTYAGGGGGMSYPDTPASRQGAGGSGGGGAGGNYNGNGSDATANTGGGGGASGWGNQGADSGAGGSGIVVVRYDVSAI